MSDPDTATEDPPKKPSKSPLIIGALLAVLGAAGGFYVTWSGIILAAEPAEPPKAEKGSLAEEKTVFISVDPLTVSLGNSANATHLRFRADLEVDSEHKAEVTQLLPRVVDVLNSYLRALEPADVEDRGALSKLRGQMLRRIQVVVGPGKVNDLLVMEFVLN